MPIIQRITHFCSLYSQKEIPLENAGPMINSANSLYCSQRGIAKEPIHVMEVGPLGFLGAYDPDPDQLASLILNNTKGSFVANVSLGGQTAFSRRRLLAVSSLSGSSFTGIANPTICLKNSDIMFFSVSNSYYPIYDK